MEVISKLQILRKLDTKKKSFQVVILDCKFNKNSYNGKILGLTLTDWIKFSCGDLPVSTYKFDEKKSILEFIKAIDLKNSDYTIILLSKTPLISKITLDNIIEYVSIKECKLCKLPVGYVIENKSIHDEKLNVDSIYSQDIEDFYLVESKAQFNYAYSVLRDRINNFHLSNGVEIISPDKTYIEPFVDISDGVIIYPNNSLKGESIISSNVILKENNVIDNSKIGSNSCLSGSVITNSVISSNVYVSAFCEIKDSLIGKDTLIAKGVSINKYKVDDNSKISANTILGETNDSDSGTR